MDHATEIVNLIYRYGELIDAGDFEAIGHHFAHCTMTAEGNDLNIFGAEAITQNYVQTTRLYPETGTPRTKHVITNPIVEIDASGNSAGLRAYYTVFQQTESLPLQPIIAGRYRDTLERVDGRWRFKTHHFYIDLIGDLSQHLLFDLQAGRERQP